MTERQILHNRFLKFFELLEVQADLSRDESSKSFLQLAKVIQIDKSLLTAYLKSEHFITHLQAYNFCKHFNLNEEEMFSDITNFIDKIAFENDLTIDTEINAVGGYALPASPIRGIELRKVQGIKGGSLIINVSGDSMSPQYNDGDRVATEKISNYSDIIDNQTYVIALEDGSHRIKRIVKSFDENGVIVGFIVISNNSKYKTDFYSIDEIKIIYRILRRFPGVLKKVENHGEEKRKKLRDLISEGFTKKVLLHLRELAPNNNDLIVYQSQFTQNQREYRRGEIELSSRDRSNARIISAILEYIDEMSKKDLELVDWDFFE